MKDLFDYNEQSEAVKNEILLRMRVNGKSMNASVVDDFCYEYFCKVFGSEEVRKSELVWNTFSERIYFELEKEELIRKDKNWFHLTDEGVKATELTYRKYVIRKKIDKVFQAVDRALKFFKGLSDAWKVTIAAFSLLSAAIIYLIGLLLR